MKNAFAQERAPLPRALPWALTLLAGVLTLTGQAAAQAQGSDERGILESGAAHIAACQAARTRQGVLHLSNDDETGPEAGLRVSVWFADGGATLCIAGNMTLALAEWAEALDTPPERAVIHSAGGLGQAGLRLGEQLRRWRADLIVWDICISACANGPFLGAVRRIVPEPGLVVWHGGLAQSRYAALIQASRSGTGGLGRLIRHAASRLEQTGRNDIPDAVWNELPREVTARMDNWTRWQARERALFEAAGVVPSFHGAYYRVEREAGPALTNSIRALRLERTLYWAPQRETLEAWGFTDVHMWEAGSEADIFMLGWSRRIPIAVSAHHLVPADFPAEPDPDWPDDSRDWPEPGRTQFARP